MENYFTFKKHPKNYTWAKTLCTLSTSHLPHFSFTAERILRNELFSL